MPTFPSLTLSFADALTQHFQEFGEKRLNAQAWPRAPLVEIMSQNAKPYTGGEYMTEVIEDGYTPTGDAFGEGSVLPVQQHNISIPAMYTPKIFYEDVYLDGFRRDKIMTNGDMGPILQWADEQVQAAGRRARENLSLMVCAAATGTAADGSTRVRSIFDIVKATGSLGNIDPTQFTYWASYVNTTSGAWSSTGPARTRVALRETKKYTGFGGPDVLFASKTTIDAMGAGGYTKTTYMRGPDQAPGAYEIGDGTGGKWTAHAPFPADAYFDQIPVYYDSHLDAIESSALSTGGILLGINKSAVYFRQRAGSVFSVQPWQKSQNKYGEFTRIMWTGDDVACNRSSNFLLTNIL